MQTLDLSKPRNEALFINRSDAWQSNNRGPRVGDFVRLMSGQLYRFTYDWGDSIQITGYPDSGKTEGFYLCDDGTADYSGPLNPGIPKHRLVPTGETRLGLFWLFDEAVPGAGRGRTFFVGCNVYQELAP